MDKAEFWEFYDAFRAFADPDGNVKEIETDLYGTPGNVDGASPWTAYTKDGKFLFEGLSLDSYIDKTIKLLVREDGIIKVQGEMCIRDRHGPVGAVAAGGGIIKGVDGLPIVGNHLAEGLIDSRVSGVKNGGIIIHLEAGAVVHMGAVF